MKKTFIQILIVVIILHTILMVGASLEKSKKGYLAEQATIVLYGKLNKKVLLIPVDGKELFYEMKFLHTYLFLSEGDKVQVEYLPSSDKTYIVDAYIPGVLRNVFTIDKIVVRLFFITIMFGVLLKYNRRSNS